MIGPKCPSLIWPKRAARMLRASEPSFFSIQEEKFIGIGTLDNTRIQIRRATPILQKLIFRQLFAPFLHQIKRSLHAQSINNARGTDAAGSNWDCDTLASSTGDNVHNQSIPIKLP